MQLYRFLKMRHFVRLSVDSNIDLASTSKRTMALCVKYNCPTHG